MELSHLFSEGITPMSGSTGLLMRIKIQTGIFTEKLHSGGVIGSSGRLFGLETAKINNFSVNNNSGSPFFTTARDKDAANALKLTRTSRA